MIAIIPALLRSYDDEMRLNSTISKLIDTSISQFIIFSQCIRPKLEKYYSFKNFKVLHYEQPATKWRGISEARKAIGQTQERIILIDADDPFEESSLRKFCKYVAQCDADCIIGRRDDIKLNAEDEFSLFTRLFIEVFSNTLVLGRIGALKRLIKLGKGPDIQSGLYAISGDIFNSIDLGYVQSYGGELAVYYQLSIKNADVIEFPIVTAHNSPSSYRVKQILKEILDLPFLFSISDEEVEMALLWGPNIYADFLSVDAKRFYESEIRSLLSSIGTKRLGH
ncbi:MAG TPA: hypothetical protein DGG95_09715 [Cytophagales bacterium]|jgi:hypothetical protein|nr:hypothetical protein [Cytophagales bacterium]